MGSRWWQRKLRVKGKRKGKWWSGPSCLETRLVFGGGLEMKLTWVIGVDYSIYNICIRVWWWSWVWRYINYFSWWAWPFINGFADSRGRGDLLKRREGKESLFNSGSDGVWNKCGGLNSKAALIIEWMGGMVGAIFIGLGGNQNDWQKWRDWSLKFEVWAVYGIYKSQASELPSIIASYCSLFWW